MKKTDNIYFVEEKYAEKEKLSGAMHFNDYAKLWMADNEITLEIKTYNRYVTLLERINMGIGHIPIGKITSHHLSCFYKNLSQDGANKRTGGKLSEKTILHHHRLISVILQQATREGIIKVNPASKNYIKPPKATVPEVQCLQIPEISKLYSLLQNESIKWRTAVIILISTGIRRGELLGLEWQDINLEHKTFCIKRTSQYTAEQGIYTKEPKTAKSKRYFAFDDNILLACLKDYKEYYEKEYGKIKEGRRLFVQRDGIKPMHPDSINCFINRFCAKYKFTKFSPHPLRHTYVSAMVALNVPLKEISEKVGHAQLSTTCNTYTHLIQMHNAKALAPIESLLFIHNKQI